MAGPYDISALGANYFKSQQLAVSLSGGQCLYSPQVVSAVTLGVSKSTILSIDVTGGDTLVVNELFLSSVSNTSGTVAVDIEVDGVLVLAASGIAAATMYIIGSATTPTTRTVLGVVAYKSFVVKASHTLTASANVNAVYVRRQ